MTHQAFTVDELREGTTGAYREFLRRPGMSLGLYRLPANGTDAQHPHASDEVYIVQSGAGLLNVEGEDIPVGPGSVISVDQGREHHFTDITEDLVIIVVFAPPEFRTEVPTEPAVARKFVRIAGNIAPPFE